VQIRLSYTYPSIIEYSTIYFKIVQSEVPNKSKKQHPINVDAVLQEGQQVHDGTSIDSALNGKAF
jgi:hypothetical protein